MSERNVVVAAHTSATVAHGRETLAGRGLADINLRKDARLDRCRDARAVLDKIDSCSCSIQTEFSDHFAKQAYAAFSVIKELAESGFERAYYPMSESQFSRWRVKPVAEATEQELNADRICRIDELVPWEETEPHRELRHLVRDGQGRLGAVIDWCSEHYPLAIALTSTQPGYIPIGISEDRSTAYRDLARSWLKSSDAPHDDPEILCDLAHLSPRGRTPTSPVWKYVPGAENISAQHFREAATLGCARAQFELGNMLSERSQPRQCGPISSEALHWYRLAASQGLASAQIEMGALCSGWRGVDQDLAASTRWYRAAAELGHSEAQRHLAWAYRRGRGVGVDETQAVHWFRVSAEHGYSGGAAHHEVARAFAQGLGVKENLNEAIRWYRAAAERGHGAALDELMRLKAI